VVSTTTAGREGRAQRRGGVETVAAGHLDVEERDVRGGLQSGGHHLGARTDLRHHLDVGLQAEHRGQRPPDERLVVGEQHLDHPVGSVRRAGALRATTSARRR
jgi:hypothetical protein